MPEISASRVHQQLLRWLFRRLLSEWHAHRQGLLILWINRFIVTAVKFLKKWNHIKNYRFFFPLSTRIWYNWLISSISGWAVIGRADLKGYTYLSSIHFKDSRQIMNIGVHAGLNHCQWFISKPVVTTGLLMHLLVAYVSSQDSTFWLKLSHVDPFEGHVLPCENFLFLNP